VPTRGVGGTPRVCADSDATGGGGGGGAGRCATRPRGAQHSATGSWRLPRAHGSPHGEPGTRGRRVPAHPTRGPRGWAPGARWGARSFWAFFSDPAPTFAAALAPGCPGADGRPRAATPWGREGAGLQGGVSHAALAGLCQRTGDLRWAPGARAIDSTLGAMAGKALAPLAQGGIRPLARGRDGVQTLPWHDVAYGVGPAQHARFFGWLYKGVSGRERVSGNVQFEGPHLRVSRNKILQKSTQAISHDVVTLLSAQNLSDSNFPEAAYRQYKATFHVSPPAGASPPPSLRGTVFISY
jgi:hypothetical protein